MAADLTIQRDVVIDAPVDVVWSTISEPENISRWFADRIDVEIRPGATGTFVFEHPDEGRSTTVAIAIDAVDPPHRLAYRWGHPEGEEATTANSTLVAFTLTPEGDDRTRLRVVEHGLDEAAWAAADKVRYADDHREGWAFQLDRLVELFR